MRAWKRSAFILAALLLLQAFCAPALAAGDQEVSVGYDMAVGAVTVEASGFEAGAMVSLMGYYGSGLDYINQYTADAAGNIDIAYPSSADWAPGGVIKVQVGSGELAEPIVKTVVLATDKPYIISCTSGLTKGYKANVEVKVGNFEAGLSAVIVSGGIPYTAAFNSEAYALVRITEVVNDAGLTLQLKKGDEVLDSKPISVQATSERIWTPEVKYADGALRIEFFANIGPSANGYKVVVNSGTGLVTEQAGNVLIVRVAEPSAQDTIIVSGVKYPELFPSYSFTFSLRYANA